MIGSGVWYTIFPKLLNMSITASVVIVFVVIARLFLRKAPKIFSYVLWSVVIFRLVCPYSFTIPFSLLNLTNPKSVENGTVVYVPEDIVHMGEPEVSVPVPVVGADISETINETLPRGSEQAGADPWELPVTVMTYVWLSGILCMAGYSAVSVVKLKKKLVGAVKLKDNIWIADHVYTSFVMGIFLPRIYLQSGLSPREQEFVILHERIHIKRCDHLVKIFFWLVLMLHWFNPLAWLSYVLCMKDMEMSCDESVMKNMKDDVRADYSQTLLSLAAGNKAFAGTPLFFGEGDIKSRIKNVLNYKKPEVWVIAAGIIMSVVLCLWFMGNPADDNSDPGLTDTQTKEGYPELNLSGEDDEWIEHTEEILREELESLEFISEANVTITPGNSRNMVNISVVPAEDDALSDEQKNNIIEYVKDIVPNVNERTILIKASSQNVWNYPNYPVYVRTMGTGSIGCEYGYCVSGEREETKILTDLEKMSGFHFNNNYSEDVALFYSEEPREIKLYHVLEGKTEYEEYPFAGEGYDYPYGAEGVKYVIRVPEAYGMHYFFAVISWEDGREDFMYFSMEYKYNPPSDAEYNSVTITKKASGMTEIKYPQLNFPSRNMESFSARLTLPQGWFLAKRGLSAADIANLDTNEIMGTFLTTYIFDGDGICVGKMGCNYYELYEGAEDNPQAIYNQVALGNHYQFNVHDTYEVLKSNDIIETGMSDVLYDFESANAGGSKGVNYGILSRSKEGFVYIALEFERELVSEEAVKAIADSISFEITGSNQNVPGQNNTIPEESTREQMVWHADLTGDGEKEIIVVDSSRWNENMLVELYVRNQNGTLLWQEEGAYAHTGWNTIFLVNISGRDYLLRYNPYMGTGAASYQYEVFGLKKGMVNQKDVYATGEVDFSDYFFDTQNADKVFPIDEMVEFADDINGYMSKGLLLFSTEDGQLQIGNNVGRNESEFRNADGSFNPNHDWVEKYSYCDNKLLERGIAAKESIDKMELREKLELYLKGCLMADAAQVSGTAE